MHYDVLVFSSCCEVSDVYKSRELVYISITTYSSRASHLALRRLSQTTLLKINGVPYANNIDTAPQ